MAHVDDDKSSDAPQVPWESLSEEDADESLAPIAEAAAPVDDIKIDGATGIDPGLSADLHIGPKKVEPRPAPVSAVHASSLAAADSDEFDEPIRGGGWTIPMLCAGIAILACCVIIPQADQNRRLAYERQKLQTDLEWIKKQVQVNAEFLNKVGDDANLAERLAQRQMRIIREGSSVLSLKQNGQPDEMSPFHLVNIAPPPPMPPYRPLGGIVATLCYSPRSRLYLMGVGLALMATGLVLGYAPRD